MRVEINKYIIILHENVLSIVNDFIQVKNKQPESGGILLGKIINGEINIMKVSTPTELDKSSRYNFERNRLSGQIVVDYEFNNSYGQTIYLGEWHTHPEDIPTPSTTDIKMMSNQFKKNILNTEYLLLIIRGRMAIYVGVQDKDGLNHVIVEP